MRSAISLGIVESSRERGGPARSLPSRADDRAVCRNAVLSKMCFVDDGYLTTACESQSSNRVEDSIAALLGISVW
jgi:hypothetical protein